MGSSGEDGARARYVAIITDGNGRWAKQRGLPVVAGHEAGADTVKARLRDAVELGVEELTVYSFSTENWRRSKAEVSALMRMFRRRIEQETPELHAEGVRLRFIGRRAAPVSARLLERMDWAERVTGENTRITLFVAFNYGGRAEIVDAARTFTGGDEAEFAKHLYAAEMHDPDLIIRTSGERRISNYLLWQGAYSELVFRDELWPDFSRHSLEQSLAEFAARKRRFGGGSQVAATRQPSRRGRRRERGGSDLLARVFVAVPAAAVAITFVDLGGLPWALFMMVIGWICLHELYRMIERWRPVALVGFASLAGMVLAGRYGSQRVVLEVAVATVPVLVVAVLARGRRGATVAVAGTLLGVYWLGFAFAHAVLLRQAPHGNGVIIDVLIGTFLGDTGAYVGGKLFGRRPLAPSISPNKTVEGLFCGMFVAVVSVFLAGLYQTWMTHGNALLLGVAVAVLGPLGDLFESVVKRDAGVKDSGQLFGAHGGALDRLDAVIFTIVAGYYVWLAVMPPG